MKRMLTITVGCMLFLNNWHSFGCANVLACSSSKQKEKKQKKYSYMRLRFASYKSAAEQKQWPLLHQKARRFPGSIDREFFERHRTFIFQTGMKFYLTNVLGAAILNLDHVAVQQIFMTDASMFNTCWEEIIQYPNGSSELLKTKSAGSFLYKAALWSSSPLYLPSVGLVYKNDLNYSCEDTSTSTPTSRRVEYHHYICNHNDWDNPTKCLECACPSKHYESDFVNQCDRCKMDYLIGSQYYKYCMRYIRSVLNKQDIIDNLVDIVASYVEDKLFVRELVANLSHDTIAKNKQFGY